MPRSMRSAALPTTMRAPSAPIGATGIAAVLRATRLGTTRAQRSQSFVRGAIPDWILKRRRRSEVALTSCSPPARVLGVSTRRLEKLAWALGITKLSKSQISEMAHSLDAEVKAFRTRPLDTGPYPIVWADALVVKVREAGGTANVHVLVVTGVNAEGHREILGVEVATSEDAAGWLACWRSLVARGLSGGGARDLEMRTVASSRRSGSPYPGSPGSGVVPTICGISWPRWPSRKQPSSGNPGAHHRRPAGRHRGGGSVPTSG